jgi:hypothetical protein
MADMICHKVYELLMSILNIYTVYIYIYIQYIYIYIYSIYVTFRYDIRDLTILGRQRDDDGQNKLLQINDSKDNS